MSQARHRYALIALTSLLSASPLDGQALRGRVIDAVSGAPLDAVAVLVHSDSVLYRALVTDSLGRFELDLPAPGEYTLTASRDRYLTVGPATFTAPAGRLLDVVLRLSTGPVVLDPIEVQARRLPNSALANARQRSAQNRRLGFGLHLDRAEIDESFAFSTSDLVRSMSVQIGSTGISAAGADAVLFTRRGGTMCTLALFVDGVRVNRDGGGLDAHITPDMIDSVEVYFGSTIVGGFQDVAGCGMVLVWSRHDVPSGFRFTWLGSAAIVAILSTIFLIR